MKKSILLFLLAFLGANAYSASVLKTIPACTAGNLTSLLTATEKTTVTKLTISSGTIDAVDFKVLKSMSKLDTLNIQGVSIAAYAGTGGTGGSTLISYPANEIPASGFYAKSVLKNIVLPATATSIGTSAFRNCTGLAGIQIPALVNNISLRAFTGCINTLFSVNATNNYFSADASGVLFDKNKTTLIQGAVIKTSYTIPGTVKVIGQEAFYNSILTNIIFGNSVQVINNSAFDNCKYLANTITLPSTLTKIGSRAFFYCSSLPAVSFKGTIVDSIQANAFSYCEKLTTIDFSSNLKFIGESAFSQCSALDGVVFPSVTDSIGNSAFYACMKLKSISLPVSLRKISFNTFRSCSMLESINLPENVKSIDSLAFSSSGLSKINIPYGVTAICAKAFYFCKALNTVTIASSVNKIGYNCFYDCDNLSTINSFPGTPPDLSASPNVFLNVNKTTCTLYVPVGKKNLYVSANQWGDFINIEESVLAGVPDIEQDNIKVFYNSQTKTLHIQSDSSFKTVTVSQLDGKRVFVGNTNDDVLRMDFMQKGVYVVNIETSNRTTAHKIMVQ